jgi:hypothetical protein
MNRVEIAQKKYELPSKWNELTYDQLIYVAGLFTDRLTITDFKATVLHGFLKLKRKIVHRIDNEDLYFLAETFNFLLKDVDLTENKISRIHRLYGPDDGMGYCTFGEFMKAQMRFDSYLATKQERSLDELTAILYRPRKHFWFIRRYSTDSMDPRQKFTERTFLKRIKQVSIVDHAIKYAVFLFFSGILQSLPLRFPNVYRQKDEDGQENSTGWAGLVISLADGKTDNESIDKVMNSNIYNVFLGLEQKSIEYFHMIEETEKIRNK